MSDESTQMQLTDEAVALALGWTWSLEHPKTYTTRPTWRNPNGKRLGSSSDANVLPPYTTSLDAIVGEIIRRKAKRWCYKWLSAGAREEWDPKDCCRAMLAYLEEHPNG